MDTYLSFQCEHKAHCFGDQATRELGTWGLGALLKHLTHEARPCAPSCDDPFGNMPSLHTAFASNFTQGRCGPELPFQVTVPLMGLTALGRVKANRHTIMATVAGAAMGAGVSALSSAVWCR